nr:triosephosphate isomerase-like [Nerophis lumbriciformis]
MSDLIESLDNQGPARRRILAANWKMHKLRGEAEEFCRQLVAGLGGSPVEVLIFPSATLLQTVSRALDDGPAQCGGQAIHSAAQGAHTGDLSAAQLVDVACSWVLCGHSERRRDHGEEDSQVADQARAAASAGLCPMVCVGETSEERHAGRTLEVLDRQLEDLLADPPARFELAYEPVWAIGTGETATPEVAQQAHAFLRRRLGERLGGERAAAVRLLYGGSANPANVAELIAEPDIDGFLVGGAGLDVEKFLDMIGRCA